MTRLLINQGYLLQGIKKWRSNTNWDQDFHNRFYKRLNRMGPLTTSSWHALVEELVSWSAIRPIPKNVIIQNGLKVIGDIDASIRNLSQTHDLQVTDLSQVEWTELKTIFDIAHAIKNSSTPMFGSKMCHFLLPNLFPIYDSQVGERICTTDYRLYWNMSRNGWAECSEKEILQNILAKQIGGVVIPTYPWATKLAELCCLGGGVQAESLSTYHNFESEHTEKTNLQVPIRLQTQKESLRIGDVLISHAQGYHYVCISIQNNNAKILWLERVIGEPVKFEKYIRSIGIVRVHTYYNVISMEDVDKSLYIPPSIGWPI